ncbi:MAG: CHAD domain-containing protein [Chloroflexota bacterium]
MYQLEQNESSADGVQRVIDEQIVESIALLSDSSSDRDVAIHETRKKIKRIRAALRLVRGALGEPFFQQENGRFRDIGRQLAPLRDSFVLLETLDGVWTEREAAVDQAGYAQVREQLMVRYEAVRQQFLGDDGLVKTAVSALQTAQTIPLPIQKTGFAPLAHGLRHTYRLGRRRMAQAWADPGSAEAFHEWRKAVKYLWHQLELLHPVWPGYLTELELQFHTLSGHLGNAHDLAELNHVICQNPVQFPPSPANAGLQAQITARQRQFEAMAWPVGQRLYAERPLPFTNRFAVYYAVWQTGGSSNPQTPLQ